MDRFSFAHSLVRETLYERPIASRRLRLHRRVAEALEFSPLPVHPAELAHHYFQARAVGGADKAILYSLEAGEAAQIAHAYEAAVEHYERVLSVLPLVRRDDAAARCDLLLALGAARWQASEPDPRSTFVQALELARGLGSPDRLARAALGRRRAPLCPGRHRLRLHRPAQRGPRGARTGRQRAARARPGAAGREPRASPSRANALELADEALGSPGGSARPSARGRPDGPPRRAAARRARPRAPADR